jgi:hypothetical protein
VRTLACETPAQNIARNGRFRTISNSCFYVRLGGRMHLCARKSASLAGDFWRSVLSRDATYSRNWSANGAWRARNRCFARNCRAWSAARSAWPVQRRGSSGHGDALDVERFVQCQADRSADVCCRGCGARHRCVFRVLHSGTASDSRRSHGCAEIRIVLRASDRQPFLRTTSDQSEDLPGASGTYAHGYPENLIWPIPALVIVPG